MLLEEKGKDMLSGSFGYVGRGENENRKTNVVLNRR
jgi:hypothetical protein